jgi:hypothetical protein
MDFKYLQDFFWPAIKDAESAKKAAEQGFMAAVLYLILSFGVVLSAQPQKLLDVLIVALCGYLAKRKQSRIAAVIGALMMAPEVIFSLQGGDMLRLLTACILLLLFVNAVRGTFLYHRYAKAAPTRPSVEVLPPEPPAATPEPQGRTGEEQKAGSGDDRAKP